MTIMPRPTPAQDLPQGGQGIFHTGTSVLVADLEVVDRGGQYFVVAEKDPETQSVKISVTDYTEHLVDYAVGYIPISRENEYVAPFDALTIDDGFWSAHLAATIPGFGDLDVWLYRYGLKAIGQTTSNPLWWFYNIDAPTGQIASDDVSYSGSIAGRRIMNSSSPAFAQDVTTGLWYAWPW